MIKVGITGGIGCGKSTVCRLFGVLGVPSYDSDLRARTLMNDNVVLVERVKQLLGEQAYRHGTLDREYVGKRVFADRGLLLQLNAIVHPVVGDDFMRWAAEQHTKYVILESAILFESGFNRYVDVTVTVSAPEDERIERCSLRDGANAESIRARMEHQMSDSEREQLADYVIYNDEHRMITDQVLNLDKIFSQWVEV